MVLSWSDGAEQRFIVLDAKYRVSRENVLDAMGKAHIYQDSLRLGPHRPDLTLLLVPAGGGAPWLEQPQIITEHRVGIVAMSPELELPAWFRDLIRSKIMCA